ncbi:MAG: T9SS type A sorting domain-containing protein [Bacteroidales bacterium]|nr:T9SS type A sorting domain-containing protein [Bacteroidales bacterium]
MKKFLLLAISFVCMQFAFAQQWNANLISSTENEIKIEINVDGFNTNVVMTPNGEAIVVKADKMMSMAQAGEPDVPSMVIPAIIGDDALMTVEVIGSEYTDYENVEIAPSKGNFPRSIDPVDVPYTYGAMYQSDAFYPASIVQLHEPYIHRDVRGQNIVVTPYSYNPATKVLRVYNHLIVKMTNTGIDDRNVMTNRAKSMSIDREFNEVYQSRYINYTESMSRYTSIADDGELLIICHDAFMTAMEPFVAWKKQIGRPTTMVGTSATGTTATAIKSYIQNYYSSHPNLTDILLVGDVNQIPGVYISANGGWNQDYSGYGDLQYGQLAGNDYYNEVIVGRFCCETEAQVTNHVNKVLNYERDLDETATWLSVGQGVSRDEGPGHFGESDYQHIDNIRDDLLLYGYTTVHRDYQGVTGVTSSAAMVSQHINEGVSIINYCNHGNITLWGVFSYSNSNVNALTNDYKLPYIISVACLNGKYDHTSDCFAEAWMRATNNTNGNPTGAIGGMFSYISQPWTPPQYGQDEMVDILVESYSNNIRRTMGGVSINGNMKVLDLGASQNANKGTYNTWILFGDPTLTLRNAVPAVMSVNAAATISTTATSLSLSATNADGALATLSRDGEIMGSATITNGSATINFSAPGTSGQATLTVFGYNKKTFVTTVNITSGGTPDPLNVNVSATAPVIAQGGNTQLNAVATGGYGNYTYSWTPAASLNNPSIANPVATPQNTTTYTCTVTSSGMTASQTCTVTVVKAPSNLTATVINTNGVRLNWTAANPVTNYTVYRNNVAVANAVTGTMWTDTNLAPGTYNYQVATNYNNVMSPMSNTATVTIFAPLSVTASANPQEIEVGQTTTLSCVCSGGNGNYTYSWTPSGTLANPNAATTVATPLETTTYTITVTAGDMTASAGVTVVVNEPQPVVCPAPDNFKGEYFWEDNEFGVKLEWDRAVYEYTLDRFEIYRSLDDENYELIKRIVNTPSISHYGAMDYDFDEPGEYYYRIIAFYQNDCQSDPITILVDVTATGEAWAEKVALYPNPTSGKVNIKAELVRQITVYNTLGCVVMSQTVDSDDVMLDMSQFENGMYLVNILTDNGVVVRRLNVIK